MNGRSFVFLGEDEMPNRTRTKARTKKPTARLRKPVRQLTPPEEPATKGERTHAAIVTAGHKLFISQGFHGTSMRQIANEAGLALGGIYNHFRSKEDIFVAILNERHPFLSVLPALQIAQGETVEALIGDAASRLIVQLSRDNTFLNLMLVELVEFKAKHIPMMFQAFFPPLMEFAQRLPHVRGPLRDIPLPVILRAFIGLFFSYVITDLIIGSQLQPSMKDKAFDYFVDIYLHGILAES
jgi:AcrR family transcriptional regulator